MNFRIFCVSLIAVITLPVHAQRVPVLSQIEHPHNYYFRELYLPQLTSGPSAVAWKDAHTLVYSMAGSLWMQQIDKGIGKRLTHDDGYDYQPDVSPDGNLVVFVRYNGNSCELMLLDLRDGMVTPLTRDGDVNLEPRWSPDGKKIVFVSTMQSGHFLVHTADLARAQLSNIKCVTPDRKSAIGRYYYGPHDHFIHPVWSRDGREIFLVTNREVVHGTGDLYALELSSGAMRPVWREETSWQMKPDVSPDGTRFVYASFAGRNWHQLWLQPIQGGYPFPLTYGEYDNRNPRWSPDGQHIAFISNRDGNTALYLITAFDGKQTLVDTGNRTYDHRKLKIDVHDENGVSLTARISVTDEQGRFYAPAHAWIAADDSKMKNARYEAHYFISDGQAEVDIPMGKVKVTATHGPGYTIASSEVGAGREPLELKTDITLKRLNVPGKWWSGDLHVHMNYAGHYRNQPSMLAKQAMAEDLQVVYNLIVNKEQRITDVSYFSPAPDPVSNDKVLVLHGQEYHTSYWGHMGLLHLRDHLILPDYAAYYQTAVASTFPHNSYIIDKAHAQGALAGYVHLYDSTDLFPDQRATMMHAFPVDAALKKIDYFELVGFANHRAAEAVWYQLLNCGLRVPAGAGTDAMANYASLRGPVGLNRVYVNAEGSLDQDRFELGLKQGRSFVTNGPLVGISVNGHGPGDSLSIDAKGQTVPYEAWLRSNVPMDHLEIVWNGKVVASHEFKTERMQVDMKGVLKLKGPGWLLVRSWNSRPHPDVMDIYPYASTNPVYVVSGRNRYVSPESMAYFVKWMNRLEQAALDHPSYRTPEEKEAVLKDIRTAKAFYSASMSVTRPGK